MPITKADAAAWFAQYHYTGTAGGSRFFAAVDDCGRLAVVGVGKGANRFGVADKFGLTQWPGDIEVTRVACHPDAPRNTASQCVAAVCRILAAEGVEWVFSYSDTAQGHHGGIYQALNAVFVGTDAKQWVNFELDGKRVSKRMVSGKFGHTRWPDVEAVAAGAGHVLRRVEWRPKLTYIIPVSLDARVRSSIRQVLKSRALPYPKRDGHLAGLTTPYRNHRPRAQSTPQPADPSAPTP